MGFINQLMKLLLPSGVVVAVACEGKSTRHLVRPFSDDFPSDKKPPFDSGIFQLTILD